MGLNRNATEQHAIEFAKEGGLKALVPLVGDDESETAQATAADLLHTLATIGMLWWCFWLPLATFHSCFSLSLSLAINGADELKTWFLAEGLIAPLLKLAKSDEVTTRKKSIKIIAQLVLNGTVELPALSQSNVGVGVGVAHLGFHAAKNTDEVANSLFQEADLLLDLLKSEDPEIQLHTTMIIGNIARSGS
jgi:hypothetical protein